MQVTRKGGREANESRDGKYVYYARSPERGIWREVRILETGRQGAWALHESGIALASWEGKPAVVLEFFDFGSARPNRAVTLPMKTGFGSSFFSISPDLHWIAYMQPDRMESDLMLVENFR